MAGIVLLALALCLPVVFVLKNEQGKKRGCGRGCATCGNRRLCHPGQYDVSKEEE